MSTKDESTRSTTTELGLCTSNDSTREKANSHDASTHGKLFRHVYITRIIHRAISMGGHTQKMFELVTERERNPEQTNDFSNNARTTSRAGAVHTHK